MVWFRREFLVKKNYKNLGRFNPPPLAKLRLRLPLQLWYLHKMVAATLRSLYGLLKAFDHINISIKFDYFHQKGLFSFTCEQHHVMNYHENHVSTKLLLDRILIGHFVQVWLLFEYPESSQHARIVAIISVFVILLR